MKKFKNLFLIAFILINAVLVSSFITISKPNEVFAVGSTHTVTFKANGGVGNDYTQIFNDYETQNLTPNTFTREGYVFASWNDNIDGLGLTHYDCDGLTLAGSDLTLYAQWAEKFIITFNENGGSEISDFNEPEGISITEPAEPTKTGYTFAGWFTDNTTFEEEFAFDTMPSDNVTLYAQWTVNTYTITFVTNGGVEVIDIVDDYNSTITLPTPTKTGYTFMGWYLDEDCTISATLTSMPSENTILYASWEAIERNIWYSIVGGMILILGIGLMFLLIRQKKYEQEKK